MKQRFPVLWIRATVITGVAALIVWIAAKLVRPEIWPPVSRPEQCECLSLADWPSQVVYAPAALQHTIREPQNTWTCFAYLFAACIIVQRWRAPPGAWAALAIAALGLGAFLYHASGSRTLRHLDMGALYWVYAMIVTLAAHQAWAVKVRSQHAPISAGMIGLGTLLFAVVATTFRNVRVFDVKPLHVSVTTAVTATLAALLMAYVAWQLRQRRHCVLLGVALTLLGVGVCLQVFDRPGNWLCDPDALVQPHALWHLASAACLGFTFEFLRSPESRTGC